MAEKSNSTSGGIGFFGILFLVFLVFKLAGIGIVADWSWWWVTAPLWGPFLFALALIAIAVTGQYRKAKESEKRLNELIGRSQTGPAKSKFSEYLEKSLAEAERNRNKH
jgi:small Trp-rich protein